VVFPYSVYNNYNDDIELRRGVHMVCRVLDTQSMFGAAMLYFNELSLVMLELLLFCTVDRLTQSFVAAAVFTYFVVEVSARLASQNRTQLVVSRRSRFYITLHYIEIFQRGLSNKKA